MTIKSDEDLQAYLDGLKRHGNRSRAAREASMTLATVKAWRKRDEQFAEAEDLALEEAADMLEEAARERAVEGKEEYFYDKDGNLTRKRTVYSDSLLSKLLDGALPHKYAQRVKSEITGAEGGPIKLEDETSAAARMASILEAARQRKANALSDDDELLN